MASLPLISCVVLLLAILLIGTTFLLRVSCHVANSVGEWTPRWAPLSVPNYRSSLGIVFMPVFVLSLLTGFETGIVASLAEKYFDETIWRAVFSLIEWGLFTVLIAMGIAGEQPHSSRLVAFAAGVHVSLLVTAGFWLSRFLAAALT